MAALLFVVLAAIAASPATAGTAWTRADWRAYRDQLQAAADAAVAEGVPGIVVYARDGKRSLTVTSGMRDLDQAKPMQRGSRFRIASISKTFVAAALLRLAGRGTLEVDDTVEHWLPGAVPNGAAISLRQVLSHTSGIPDYDTDPDFTGPFADPDRIWTPEELLAIAVANPPDFEPGTSYAYSNTNYVVAGLVAEAATGRPLGDVLEREIFGPLRLRRTSFEEDPDLPGAFAHGYYVFGGLWQERGVYEPSSFWGAGNLASSARDVGRFFRELLSGALLEDPQLQEMKTLYPTPSDAYLQGYGLGLYRNTFGGCAQEWWGHDGQLQGYASVAVNAEDASRQVVILVNSSSFPWAEWDMGPDLQAVFDSAWCGLFR